MVELRKQLRDARDFKTKLEQIIPANPDFVNAAWEKVLTPPTDALT